MPCNPRRPVAADLAHYAMSSESHPDGGGLPETSLPPNLTVRIPELDGLRGIAIALVVYLHFVQEDLNPQVNLAARVMHVAGRLTWSGVDLFFVLSGFLIGGILLDSHRASNYFRVFYTRRFFRIVPLYAAVLLAFLFLSRFVHGSSYAWLFAGAMPWYSYCTFTQNFWMAVRGSMSPGGLGVTWSLAVEEQFYLTLPFLIRMLSKSKIVHFILAALLLIPMFRVFLFYRLAHGSTADYVLMPCRADALLLGVLAAILLRDAKWKAKIGGSDTFFYWVLAILLGGIVVLSRISSDPDGILLASIGYTWLALFYTGVLLYAVTRPTCWLSKGLRNSGLRWLGMVAYCVYLIHIPVREMFLRLFWPDNRSIPLTSLLLIAAFSFAITLVIARISWKLFEKPLIAVGHRYRIN